MRRTLPARRYLMSFLLLARHRSKFRLDLLVAQQQRRYRAAPFAASTAAEFDVVDDGNSPPTSTPSASSSSTSSSSFLPSSPPTSVYVHLPFCVKKCYYCDFPVRALGERGASSLLPGGERGAGEKVRRLPEGVAAYLDTLLAEIDATSVPNSSPSSSSSSSTGPLQTVSFGGGTPSLLPPEHIARIVEAVAGKFGPLAEGAEVSLEADPGTFDADSLRGYVELAGVTRLSLGVQSFDEGILKGCGRSHGLREVEEALRLVSAERERGRGNADDRRRQRGLKSWSLDLVAGLPGLDRRAWRETLERAVRAGPDHVSVYDLQLEAGTPFGEAAARLLQSKSRSPAPSSTSTATKSSSSSLFSLPGPLPREEEAAQMIRDASSILSRAGYTRYEVSNFARRETRNSDDGDNDDGDESPSSNFSHESRHNRVYWRGDEDYYAFGLGASSRLRGVRVTRPRSMRSYSRFVEELRARGDGVPREDDCFLLSTNEASDDRGKITPSSSSSSFTTPFPSPRDILLEVAMLRLRTADGLDLGEVATRWGEREAEAIRAALSPSVEAGFAKFSSPSEDSVGRHWPLVRLTDPEGFLVSNSVISDVFVALDAVPESL